ncbi:hypothetical protein SISSUDRAFT_1132413 [Sistotremastrum suecicum HHB10207 ss-3]|uniref:Uncharacterized protein n=1 Tax=Sistotremastrum suecicum HHB10207 ss-3 TaxID=1314776 RepID=A0A165YVF5_9AGAM|nr:hypothetical protein SISSUDRAFT_1132413 [Sistotremastrum suecicum HHB10207 ss-3]
MAELAGTATSAFINRLPDEIVGFIMWHLVYKQDLQDLISQRLPRDSTHLTQLISRVCRRWRWVALNNPSLWAQIHFGWSLAAISIYLERSRDAHLSLAIHHSYFESQHFQLVKDSFRGSMRRLERLSISWTSNLSEPPELMSWIDDIIKNRISTPILSQLHLDFPGVPRSSSRVESLEHLPRLSIICSSMISLLSLLPDPCRLTVVDASSFGLTSAQILTFLSSAPMLELVTLAHQWIEDIVPPSGDDEFQAAAQTIPVIHLRHLEKFTLGWGSKMFYDEILRNVTFPQTANIFLSVARGYRKGILDYLPSTLLGVFKLSVHLEVQIQDFEDFTSAVLVFKAARHARFHLTFDNIAPLTESGRIRNFQQQVDYRVQETAQLFEHLATYTFLFLRNILVSGKYIHSLELNTISGFLASLKDIEQLTIRTIDVDGFLDALGLSELEPCPSLRRLDIRGCEFDAEHLEGVIVDRFEWAVKLDELKVTFDPRMKIWRYGCRSAADIIRDLPGYNGEGDVLTSESESDEDTESDDEYE